MEKSSLAPDDVRHLATALRRLSFFQNLSMGDLERFFAITRLYTFPSGAVVFKQGEVGDGLYVVRTGRVRVFRRALPLFPTKTLSILGPGEVFGEMALIDQPLRTASVTTLEPSALFVILSSNFNQILRDNPHFQQDLRRLAQERRFETRHG